MRTSLNVIKGQISRNRGTHIGATTSEVVMMARLFSKFWQGSWDEELRRINEYE